MGFVIVLGLSGLFILSVFLIALLGPLFPYKPKMHIIENIDPLLKIDPEGENINFDIEAYLLQKEGRVKDLKPDAQKKIFWYDVNSKLNPNASLNADQKESSGANTSTNFDLKENRKKTAFSIIYFHGFTASRRDLSPTIETLAESIGAHLFMTRMKGSGTFNVNSYFHVKADDWFKDAEEAFAIGQHLGEKVIVVGMSTGAAQAIYLAQKYPDKVASLVILSPNFKPIYSVALWAQGPLGRLSTYLIAGFYMNRLTIQRRVEEVWDMRYRTESVVAMMNMLKYVNSLNLQEVKMPLLTVYTEKDKVVSVSKMKEKFKKFNSKIKEMVNLPESNEHRLAGDIVNPVATVALIKTIEKFLNEYVTKSKQ